MVKKLAEQISIKKIAAAIIGQFTGCSMPMSLFVLQNNVFYVLLGYFLEKAGSTEKCRQLSWWKLSAGLAVNTNIRGARVIACLGSCAFGVYLLEHIGQKLFLKLYLQLAERTFGIFACSVYICCILMFSFVCTWLIRKSKIVRKFIQQIGIIHQEQERF